MLANWLYFLEEARLETDRKSRGAVFQFCRTSTRGSSHDNLANEKNSLPLIYRLNFELLCPIGHRARVTHTIFAPTVLG